jgi:hypothetical protein
MQGQQAERLQLHRNRTFALAAGNARFERIERGPCLFADEGGAPFTLARMLFGHGSARAVEWIWIISDRPGKIAIDRLLLVSGANEQHGMRMGSQQKRVGQGSHAGVCFDAKLL